MPRVDYALSPAQRIQARQAFGLIEGTGLDLIEVVHRGLGGQRAALRLPIEDVYHAFLKSRIESDCRPKTIEFYEAFLRPIRERFEGEIFDTITRAALAKCVSEASAGATARTSIARAARALWRFAMHQPEPMAAADASVGLRFVVSRREGRKVAILTIEQCEAILRGAGKYRSALALMLGAGIRPEEIRGRNKSPMMWGDVDVTHSAITVRAECAKTRKERIIENPPPMLWQWLEPGAAKDPISPALTRSIINVARTLAGLDAWPQDATRHTFASYALALTQDPGRVALWLGHEESPKMLHSHYHRPGLRAPAVRFFSLCNEGATCALKLKTATP